MSKRLEDSPSKKSYQKPQIKRITLERLESVLAFCKYNGGYGGPDPIYTCETSGCLSVNTTYADITCGS